MSRLIVECKGNKINMACEATGDKVETTDQEQAINNFKNWLYSGAFPIAPDTLLGENCQNCKRECPDCTEAII